MRFKAIYVVEFAKYYGSYNFGRRYLLDIGMPILLSVLQLTVLVAVGDHTFEEMSRGKCGWYVHTL